MSLAALGFVVFLPSLVTWQVNRILGGLLSKGAAEFRLSHVGLYRSDLSIAFLEGGARDAAAVKIDSCVLEYRPLRLLAGQIDSVRLSGVTVRAVVTNGVLRIPVMDMIAPGDGFYLSDLQQIPVSVANFRAEGNLVLDTGAEIVLIPLNVGADFEDGWNKLTAHVGATLSTSYSALRVACDTQKETMSIEAIGVLASDSLPYSTRKSLPESLRRISSDFRATSSVDLDGGKIEALSLSALCNTWIETDAGMFDLHPSLNLKGDGKKIEASLTGLKASVAGLTASLDVTNIVVDVAERKLRGHVVLGIGDNKPVAAEFAFSTNSVTLAMTESSLKNSGRIKAGAFEISYEDLGVRVFGEIGTPVAISGTLGVGKIHLLDSTGAILTSADNGIKLDLGLAGEVLVAAVSMPSASMPKAEVTANDFTADFKGVDKGAGMQVAGDASVKISWRGTEVCGVATTLSQSNKLYAVNGEVRAAGVLGKFASFADTGAKGGMTVTNSFVVEEQRLDLSSLPEMVPQLAGFDIGGKLSASAGYYLTPKSSSGAFKMRFSEGSVTNLAKGYSASDIRATFELPDLPELSSNSQFFGFKNLKIGSISLESGMAIFRMHSPTVWYMDNLILNWCEGKIRAESTRLSPENKKTRLTLHGDRLNVASLLEQFGVGKVTGAGGKLSGTIPIVIENGEITFRDGYLYSTPGEKGQIVIEPSDTLKESAAASVETSLAVDALSDFSYSWMRLGLNSDADNLMLKFEMDGKPMKKLYYFVNEKGIVKSKNPSEFKGIVLDATFKLPINQALSLIGPVSEMMKVKGTK